MNKSTTSKAAVATPKAAPAKAKATATKAKATSAKTAPPKPKAAPAKPKTPAAKPKEPAEQNKATPKTTAPVVTPQPAVDPEIQAMFEPPKPLEHSTDVYDEYDLASMREMEMTAEAVRRARENAQIKAPDDWDGESCYDCGFEIEKGRFKLGYYTCIHCERKKEVRSRQFRR